MRGAHGVPFAFLDGGLLRLLEAMYTVTDKESASCATEHKRHTSHNITSVRHHFVRHILHIHTHTSYKALCLFYCALPNAT